VEEAYSATLFYGESRDGFWCEESHHPTLRMAKAWVRARLRSERRSKKIRMFAFILEGPERSTSCVGRMESDRWVRRVIRPVHTDR